LQDALFLQASGLFCHATNNVKRNKRNENNKGIKRIKNAKTIKETIIKHLCHHQFVFWISASLAGDETIATIHNSAS